MNNQIVGDSLSHLFNKQMDFQKEILAPEFDDGKKPNLPFDSIYWFKYHCLAMIEEMGEVMKADKRWKTHRNKRYEPEEKLDELSDVFITFMNLCIYSGFTPEQVHAAVESKIKENFERLSKKK